jgi:hypothetical protein
MITLSTEHSLEIGAPQRTWLEAQLASVNRTAFPWLVVAMHRPMYTSEYEVSVWVGGGYASLSLLCFPGCRRVGRTTLLA